LRSLARSRRYFSGSIALLPDPAAALRGACKVLKKGGAVYVTQTFQHLSFPGLSVIKPCVKYITTIDFGELVMEKDILRVYASVAEELELVRHEKIEGSVDNALQKAYVSVLRKIR
jgi:hypothetical protein